jgi:membrane protease YdiL (CAAX protease family)
MTQILCWPLLIFAAGGLAVSLAVHLVSIAGLQPLGGQTLFYGMDIGIVLLLLPAFLISARQNNGKWADVSASPAWIRYVAAAFLIYVFVLAVVSIIVSNTSPSSDWALAEICCEGNGPPPVRAWRGFSSGWMLFYSMGLAIIASAIRKNKYPNGR